MAEKTTEEVKAFIAERITSDIPRDISGQDNREALNLLADEDTFGADLDDNTVSVPLLDGSTITYGELKGLKQNDVLKILMFPTLNPTYTPPSHTIALNSGLSYVEVGAPRTFNLRVVYTKNDAGEATKLKAYKDNIEFYDSDPSYTEANTTNIPDQFSKPNPNSPNKTFTELFSDVVAAIPDAAATIVYKSSWRYAAGLPKLNNAGVSDPRTPLIRGVNAPQAAETGDAWFGNNLTINVYRPYFWFISDSDLSGAAIAALIAANDPSVNKVLASSIGDVTINFGTSALTKYHYVVFPDQSPTVAGARLSWFTSETNKGVMDGSSLWTAAASISVNSPDSYWSGVSYKFHKTLYKTGFQLPMQLRVTSL